MNKLKSCPFCGGKAEMRQDHHDYSNGEHTTTYEVYCTRCLLSKQPLQCKESAIEMWNTRADGWISVDDELPDMLENVLISITNDMVDGNVSEAVHQMSGQFLLPSEIATRRMSARPCVGVTHWMTLPSAHGE